MPPRISPREKAKISSPEGAAKPKRPSRRQSPAEPSPAHAEAFRLFCQGSSIRQIGRLLGSSRDVVELWARDEHWLERRQEAEEAARQKIERQATKYLAEIRESGLRVRAKLLRRIEAKIERGQRVTAQELNWLAQASDKADSPINNPRQPLVAVQNNTLGGMSIAEVLLSDGWKQWSEDPANITPRPRDDVIDAELASDPQAPAALPEAKQP
jgi:hypothetical protein